MAKSQTSRGAPKQPLTETGKEIINFVVNRIAFEKYSSCCDQDSIAIGLGKSAKRLQTTLNKLAYQGWLTIEGRGKDKVYPTVAALRWQATNLSTADAEKLLRKIRRA